MTVENLEIKVKTDAGDASKEIKSLNDVLDKLAKIVGSITINDGIASVGNAAKKAKKDVDPLSERMQNAIAEADRYTIALHKVADAKVRMEKAFENGNEAAAWAARERELNASAQVDKFAPRNPVPIKAQEIIETADAVAFLNNKLIDLEDAMQEAFAEGDTEKAWKLRGQILQTEKALKKAENAANGASKATKRFGESVKEANKSAKKATTGFNKFASSLMRIAKYRLFRTIIKEITSSFSEGLQYAYAFSQGITTEGHRFAQAMDSMSSAGLQMKNQLGSALISLLTALMPLILSAINLITRLADAMSQLFAVFTGGTYLKAEYVPKAWAEEAGKASKAAKEWKNQLMGFDEINRLEEPASTGGGTANNELDPSIMFKDTPIDGIFAKIKAKLDELKNSLNFEPLKQAWDKLKESLGGLAETISGGLKWAWDNVLVPLAHWTIERLAPELVTLLANAFSLLDAILQRLAPYFDWFWQNVLRPCFNFIGDVVIKVLQTFNGLLEKLAKLIRGDISFSEFIKGLTTSESIIGVLLIALGAKGLIGLLTHLADVVLWGVFLAVGKVSTALAFLASNPIVLVIAGIAALIVIGIQLYRHWDELIAKIKQFQKTLHDALNDGKLNWKDFAYIIVRTITAPIDAIIRLVGWVKTLIGWIRSAVQWLDRLQFVKSNVNRMTADGSIYLQGFASGGFPEDGQLFLAREGTAPELVGEMGGHTAVANNDQIVEGIRAGVYDAVSSAMANKSGNGTIIMNVNGREFMRATYNDRKAVDKEKGISLITNFA